MNFEHKKLLGALVIEAKKPIVKYFKFKNINIDYNRNDNLFYIKK